MGLPAGYAIETVRGTSRPELSDQLISFWTDHGVLDEPAARRRIDQVVCVLRDPAGGIAATNSVNATQVPLIGGRSFWIYRTFGPSTEAGEAFEEMLLAAFERLRTESAPVEPGCPVGLCHLLTDRAAMEARPEPVWEPSGLMFAGYTDRGEQVRIRYFEGARI